MKSLSDGWHPLPSGGVLAVNRGQPLALSDGGRRDLDDGTLLREASDVLDAKLEWRNGSRHQRWQSAPWLWTWTMSPALHPMPSSIARLCIAGCSCAMNAGERWVIDPMDGARAWACERCAHSVEVHHVWLENAPVDCDCLRTGHGVG